MILHIFNYQEKFSTGYFRFLYDNNVDLKKHMLFHYGKRNKSFSILGLKTIFSRFWISIIPHLKLLYYLFTVDKIIIHCLASPILLFFLNIFPFLNNKTYWVIWGKDLYFYHNLENKSVFHIVYEYMRKRVIQRIAYIVPIFKEEYDLARKWYKVKGVCIECNLLYPYSININNEKKETEKTQIKNKFSILLGNSASKTNNHIEMLKLLSTHIGEIETIYCPLSYGGPNSYIDKVIKVGHEYFGDKFIPIVEFMPYNDYMNILQKVDIAIFNHNRQEGLGNIYSLINMKKTIYIRSDITTWKFFQRINIKVLDTNSLRTNNLTLLNDSKLEINRSNLSKIINPSNSLLIWLKIFDKHNVGG
jgi:hypothetical protein